MNIRFGLCCIFLKEDIKFKTTTVTHILKLERSDAIKKLSSLCLHNSVSLMQALEFCKSNQIGCFRINSSILPIKTHDAAGYDIKDLPDSEEIINNFQKAGQYAKENNIRTCFHPDQFVVLNSPKESVVSNSIKEIEYQADVAEWVNADVVNIHAGAKFGGKEKCLEEFCRNFKRISSRARNLLTLENDDVSYTPEDLLPICEKIHIPLVYDIHHHRCNPDSLSEEFATKRAKETWNREPLFHLSSPINGYESKDRRSHHDYIDQNDFPAFWRDEKITVEIEAKAKEIAIRKLMLELNFYAGSPLA